MWRLQIGFAQHAHYDRQHHQSLVRPHSGLTYLAAGKWLPSTVWAATPSWPTQLKGVIPCCRQVAAPYDLDSTAILADAVRQRLRRRVAMLWADSLVFAQKGPPLQLQWQDSEAGLAAVFRRGAAAPAHISDRSAASSQFLQTNNCKQAGGWHASLAVMAGELLMSGGHTLLLHIKRLPG